MVGILYTPIKISLKTIKKSSTKKHRRSQTIECIRCDGKKGCEF